MQELNAFLSLFCICTLIGRWLHLHQAPPAASSVCTLPAFDLPALLYLDLPLYWHRFPDVVLEYSVPAGGCGLKYSLVLQCTASCRKMDFVQQIRYDLANALEWDSSENTDRMILDCLQATFSSFSTPSWPPLLYYFPSAHRRMYSSQISITSHNVMLLGPLPLAPLVSACLHLQDLPLYTSSSVFL